LVEVGCELFQGFIDFITDLDLLHLDRLNRFKMCSKQERLV
jgi:hypothetical protein